MERQGVQILLDVPEGMELPLRRSPIERVFFNLITNALEAMPGGGKISRDFRFSGPVSAAKLG
jgi:signal transduction histidine kinase